MGKLAKRMGVDASSVEPVVLADPAARVRFLRQLRQGAPSALWVRQPEETGWELGLVVDACLEGNVPCALVCMEPIEPLRSARTGL
jgi:hypothetical protein